MFIFSREKISKPSEPHETCLCSLLYFTKAQGALLDLHGHPNGPINGPCEANFKGLFGEKGPSKLIFLKNILLDNRQTKI